MSWVRRTLATVLAVVLLTTGCGGDSSDENSVTTIGLLSSALANTAEAGSYRISASTGITLKMYGVNLSSELDEDNPSMVGEVSPERGYFRINLSAVLGSFLGESPGAGDELVIEMWDDRERMVMDTTSFQYMVGAPLDDALGPMAPGVFFIDLTAIEAESPELLGAVAGNSTPDLAEMAVRLPGAMVTIEQTSTNPVTFVGTTTSAGFSEALGGDAEVDARADAANFGQGLHSDVDELTQIFMQVAETNTVELRIELDEQGLLSVLWMKEDMSNYLRALVESDGFAADMSEEERIEGMEVFESAELGLELRIAYEPDANLEVPLPPPTDDDRTEEWREYLTELGYLD